MKVQINPKIFNSRYIQLFHKPQGLILLFGGGSSGKSFHVAMMVALWAFRGEAVLVARATLVSIRKSVWLEVNKAIDRLGLGDYFRVNVSNFEIWCPATGGSIQFVGCENNAERVKSITPKFQSAFTKCWAEEVTEIPRAALTQLRIRMRGESKWSKQTIYTFNPIYKSHTIYVDYFEPIGWEDDSVEYENDDIYILKCTYKDNRFLGEDEINYLESLKEVTPYHYNVYTLGNFGVLGSRVFENWEEEAFDIEKVVKKHDDYQGCDFGYSVDPAAVVFCAYDERNKIIYIYDEIYRKGLTNDLLADAIKEKQERYHNTHVTVYCDSAEPKSIKELQNYNINARPTVKGKDSILKGIDWLLQNKIKVHPRCKNTKEELQLYVRQEKNGEILPTPVDRHNHCIDSIRYGFNQRWKGSGRVVHAQVKY